MRGRDIVGENFGKLLVLKYVRTNHKSKKIYLCKCSCGREVEVKRNSLVTGHTKSCGCLPKKGFYKHGMRRTRLYSTWLNMKDRCYNKNNSHYAYYGEKGIILCEDWEKDFTKFYVWAKNNNYKAGLSIERIDNSKGYNPENCKWILCSEQSKNKTSNVYVVIEDKTYTLAELSREYNIIPSTMYTRYKRGARGVDLIKPVKNKEEK